MMIIRPAAITDLDALYQLSQKTGSGLTTLPKNMELLEEKIEDSQAAFNAEIKAPGLEYYLFMLEDSEHKTVVGTSALAATVGLSEAFYTYHLGTVVHSSPELGVHNVINALYLGNDFTGSSEICTLFLDPAYRKNGNGQLLSRSRFLFMAENRHRFAPKLIAEMRGFSDDQGRSPFWDAIGRHFFSMDFLEADALSGEGNNQFIAELMPKYPIYLSLLSEQAREVIGKTHPDTVPALKMLEREGFEYRGYVDIFDAGPTIEVNTDKIKSIELSNNYSTRISDNGLKVPQKAMLANHKLLDYRACLGEVSIHQQTAFVTRELADALLLEEGDPIRVLLQSA
jgi:arginine N-succinyltransferase